MHYRLYVIGEAKSRDEFAGLVEQAMSEHEERYEIMHDEGCDDDSGYCDCPSERLGFWDWYVIGGRWSGVLEDIHPLHLELEKEWLSTCEKAPFSGYFIPNNETKAEFREKLTRLIIERKVVGNEYYSPIMSYDKNQYRSEGYASDIQPFTQRIFDLISQDGVIKDIPDEWGDRSVLFIDGAESLDHVPENYWIAVVDYHN